MSTSTDPEREPEEPVEPVEQDEQPDEPPADDEEGDDAVHVHGDGTEDPPEPGAGLGEEVEETDPDAPD
jgi:hypothetical protein